MLTSVSRFYCAGTLSFLALLTTDIISDILKDNLFHYALAVFACIITATYFQQKKYAHLTLIKSTLYLNKKYLFTYTVIGLAITQLLFSSPPLKMIVFFFAFSPTTFIIIKKLQKRFFQVNTLWENTALSLPILLLITCIIPGFYAAPVFNGIAGWVVHIPDRNADIYLSGYKFQNDTKEDVWATNGLSNPISLMWRNIGRAQSNEEQHKNFLNFIFTMYTNNFHLLEQGIYPNQKYLGILAYPGHNPYLMQNYKDFPPSEITNIIYVTETYDRKTLQLKDKTIYNTYNIQNNSFLK